MGLSTIVKCDCGCGRTVHLTDEPVPEAAYILHVRNALEENFWFVEPSHAIKFLEKLPPVPASVPARPKVKNL